MERRRASLERIYLCHEQRKCSTQFYEAFFMKRLHMTGGQLVARYNDQTNNNKEQEHDINDMETDAGDPEIVDDTRQELDANAKVLMTKLLKQYKAEFEV